MRAGSLIFISLFLTMHIFTQDIDWQGHRGCRGLMPENTIPAFLKALEFDIRTIEMDIVVCGDGDLIVSHEPWMSHQICSHPDGRPVLKEEAMSLNIFKMTTAEVQQFDCGKRGNPRFTEQESVPAFKPTLKQAIQAVHAFCEAEGRELPDFNIEIKSHPDGYHLMVPPPDIFVPMVTDAIRTLGIEEKTTLQSFDTRVLEKLNEVSHRKFRIAYLVQNGNQIMDNLSVLSFRPDVYSPFYRMVKKKTVKLAHALGIRVIPWTVNSSRKMKKLLRKNVDGIITDYPNRIPATE